MKKNVFLFLTLVLCTGTAVYAQASGTSIIFKNQSGFDRANADLVAFNARALHPSYQMETYHYAEWKVNGDGSITKSKAYIRAKHTRNIGIGLMAGGAASLVLGTAMIADGVTSIKRNGGFFNNPDISNLGHFYEVYFGSAFAAAGLGMTIPGAVVFSRGVAHMRKAKERMSVAP